MYVNILIKIAIYNFLTDLMLRSTRPMDDYGTTLKLASCCADIQKPDFRQVTIHHRNFPSTQKYYILKLVSF